jgi:putative transposase
MSILYHVMSRGVDKRTIFQDDRDRLRFIHNLSAFNTLRRSSGTFARCSDSPLVEIYAFCLMPNHYHIFLKPLEEGSMSRFLQKLGNGYVQYFNRRHDRKGVLYETRFKRVEVVNERHFTYLPYYIHSNPLDLFDSGWRTHEIADSESAWEFLENYRWSSHLDYLGRENFPAVIKKEFLLEYFGGTKEYGESFRKWISDLRIPKSD